jgi:hypothetical protein
MKLYELHRGENFTLLEQPVMPPDIQGEAPIIKLYTLNNIDGMYSHCQDNEGHVYHFAAWTEVEPLND